VSVVGLFVLLGCGEVEQAVQAVVVVSVDVRDGGEQRVQKSLTQPPEFLRHGDGVVTWQLGRPSPERYVSACIRILVNVLGHHDGRHVGGRGRYLGQDRGVDHAQCLQPANRAGAVDDSPGVAAVAHGNR
jgi:hypothetical protein